MGEIKCPECGKKMMRAGKVWSGRTQKQSMLCNHCGRRKVVSV